MQVNQFSADDQVYVVDTDYGILLTHLSQEEDGGLYTYNPIKFQINPVTGHRNVSVGPSALPYVIHATRENENHLKAIFGEELVPKIPLTGNELADKLLRRQKYIVARVSNESQRDTTFGPVRLVKALHEDDLEASDYSYSEESTDALWRYATPVDMNGVEINEEQVLQNGD